jgi:hypothetical protein
MKAKYWNILFLLFLLLDISYSFYQNLNTSLLGDIADIGLPTKENQEVLNDPLGFEVAFQHKSYIGAGRFFAHWSFYNYYRIAPFIFQSISTPIESIYLSAAFAKTAIQLMLIMAIAAFIYYSQEKDKQNFLFSMVLIAPLFQIEGFNRYMNIIDKSIVYTFFYPLFLGFLAIYLLFFFKSLYNQQPTKFGIGTQIFLLIFSFIISLSCPLNPGIILIAFPLILLTNLYHHFQHISNESFIQKIAIAFSKIDRKTLFLFSIICFFCLYSLYLSRSHSDNFNLETSLMQRYAHLPAGLYFVLFSKLGFPLLLFLLIINVFLLKKQGENIQAKQVLNLLKWLGIFAILYILLLPLGGARVYRPNIIRGDTFMPVTLVMIFAYAFSTHFLVNTISGKIKNGYFAGIAVFLFVFTISDEPNINNNACERAAMKEISEAKDSVVLLHSDCPVMAWNKLVLPEHSITMSKMFQYWGITQKNTLFYHANP